ncbi:MAG: cellulase family glycosylhydrolase [Armatimonadota bacterium]
MLQPIRIHPDNPKLFEFRGKPLVLLTATEHYGAVMNRPFEFERYLADAAEKKMTMTRLFTLFRELQSAMNPYSTCKPESPDYVAPFARTKTSKALDWQPLYDLDTWNPEFFERLHRFLSLASDYGIIVEVTLLSNTYGDGVWMLNPLHHLNNINGLDPVRWQDYNTQRNRKLFEAQVRHVRKIVEETKRYDNIIYEICNEPGGFVNTTDANLPSPSEVDEWQMAIADVIRDAESDTPYKHLISGQEAFAYDPFTQTSLKSFRSFGIDVVNMHPLPNTTFSENAYHMGEFMMKQLNLRALRDYCLDTHSEPKPMNFDEDNSASQYKDFDGWTIHRKRAWTTLMSGGHYDYIDFSIINGLETGTPDSQRCIRSWMRNLSEFIHSIDLVRARPMPNLLKQCPEHTLESVFGITGEDYCIYLADDRELDEEGCGEAASGEVVLDMPVGQYRATCFSPVSGLYSPWIEISGGEAVTVNVPEFIHDIVIRIQRKDIC